MDRLENRAHLCATEVNDIRVKLQYQSNGDRRSTERTCQLQAIENSCHFLIVDAVDILIARCDPGGTMRTHVCYTYFFFLGNPQDDHLQDVKGAPVTLTDTLLPYLLSRYVFTMNSCCIRYSAGKTEPWMKWQTPREATFCVGHAITAVSPLIATLVYLSLYECQNCRSREPQVLEALLNPIEQDAKRCRAKTRGTIIPPPCT